MDRDIVPQPTSHDISELLRRLAEEFDLGGADRYQEAGHWERPRSGSSFYRMTGSPSGPDLVVKVVPGWEPGTAERMFDTLVDLDDVIASSHIEGVRGIRPLAWSDDPPALVMPYVESTDLVSILRQPEHTAWASGLLDRWIERAGALLAAYHGDPGVGFHGDIQEAADEVRRLATRAGIGADLVDRILTEADWRTVSRVRYGDYGPGNLQAAPDGMLYLLDPPDERRISVVHRDMSNFLFEMRRQLAGRGFTPSRPLRGRFADLEQRFLLGYGLEIGRADEALIALFEFKRALAMARKRFPSRPGDAFWFTRLAARRRVDVARAMRATDSD